ncbi:MAG: hypothetical protein INH37_26990, partial [Myxococcaceae bacterium]|nr:hypothetical protein [Myxococcaceae bacterium]
MSVATYGSAPRLSVEKTPSKLASAQHTFGVDVLRCPCGGGRRIHAIHSTR